MRSSFTCHNCGKCCNTYPIDIGYSDICRWREEKRNDILQQVSFINNYPSKGYAGFYIEKTLRNPKQPCPFWNNERCSIYETRPMVCKDFPQSHDDNCCKYYEDKIPTKARRKIQSRQEKDLKKSLQNYNSMMAVLVGARH